LLPGCLLAYIEWVRYTRRKSPGENPMFMKILIVSLLILILGSLAMALVAMVKDRGQSERTVRALTIRIGMSIGLLIFIMLGYAAGFISPNGI
ncbi:MAG: twin transmembrane helix small protein, partial [Gammaproteobacteria bacterium]|nr:twin transmembrane helix small protein [Gammaproteobacteria bacterium]